MRSRTSRARRTTLVAVVAVTAAVACAALAVADDVHNDVANSSQSSNNQAQTGTEFPVQFWVQATPGDTADTTGPDGNRCNPSNGTPATLTLTAPAGSGLTFSPSELVIDECANGPNDTNFVIDICPTKAGTFAGANVIQAHVTDADGATYNLLNADVELTVTGDDVDDCDPTNDGGTTVTNHPPTVDLPAADAADDEGQTLQTNGGFADEDVDDSLTIAARLDDGSAGGAALPAGMTFTDNGDGTWDWSFPTDDDYSGTIDVTATDESGATATDEFTYQSLNVDPDITNPTHASGTACKPTVSFGIADPGTADTFASAVDFNGPVDVLASLAEEDDDASLYTASTSRSVAKSAVYPSTGTKTVSIGVKDDDGGSDADELTIVVPNTVAQARFGPPVQTDGNAKGLFKAGSTIPVKVRAAACAFETDGSYTPVSGANLRVLTLAYVGPDTSGTPVTATSNVKANSDGWMRPSLDQYIYNLQLPKTARGTYTLAVEAWNADKTAATGVVAQKDIAIR